MNLKVNKRAFQDTVIFLTIVSLPFLYYLHKYIPEEPVLETKYFVIISQSYGDVSYLFWVFASKALLLIGCLIWFFTCQHWWRNVILLPIILTSIQIFVLFDDDVSHFDEVDYIYVIPLGLTILAFIHWFSDKIKYYSNMQEFLIELDREIDTELRMQEANKLELYTKAKSRLMQIRSCKKRMSSKDYLIELVEIKSLLMGLDNDVLIEKRND